MKTSEIRSRFLDYFKRHQHEVVESSSLVPHNDPTLLFTTAGMVQFKDVFLGKDRRTYKRAASVQKCVRAGGKHNDLENVGFTARHHTFFEMLGNFSFGDYFKSDAIRFGWEFVTQDLKIPKDKLYVTVFETDDDAADIWHKQEGGPKDRIYRFGEKDNFWAMGDTGPCGPCSEIFVDRGEKYSCGKPTCKMGCDCDRYMEIWNLVFMQYNRDSSGTLNPLPKPSVDTGAGLERIASVLQDVETNYDTDGFAVIFRAIGEELGRSYDRSAADAASFRVIADHARAATFLIGDGVMPSNEGRGYVLRRIMRRAIRHGKKLGFTKPFLSMICAAVMEEMQSAYPGLRDQAAFIAKAVFAEEEQFLRTLERGLILLDEETAKLKAGDTLPGEVAFKLYDTFGFPLDLTRTICDEHALKLDQAGFEKAMARQKAESRKSWKGSGQESLDAIYLQLANKLRDQGKKIGFVGYDALSSEGQCWSILSEQNGQMLPVDSHTQVVGTEAPVLQAIFLETPFYAESGGQVGDQGRVSGGDFVGKVLDVQKPAEGLTVVHIQPVQGTLKVGQNYTQQTDREIRALTARNHTATHLLHWALHKVLGAHVKQAGSLVSPELLRFDFSHFQQVTKDELEKVENMINEKIWAAHSVSKKEMAKDEAIAAGAIAFFGEKYGDRVRVVKVGDFSTELCGGTHVDNSSDIHLFKIASEGSVASGVRRIIAFTSKGAFEYLRKKDLNLAVIQERLKAATAEDVLAKLEKLSGAEKDLRKQIEQLQAKGMSGQVSELLAEAKTIGAVKLVALICEPDAQGAKKLRDLADMLVQKSSDVVAVLGMKDPTTDKASLLIACGTKAQATVKANDLLKELAPLIDGKGGGKPEMAQAGGTKSAGLSEALTLAAQLIAKK